MELSTGRLVRTLQGYSNGVWSITFSPDGDTLASGSEDSSVRLWDISTGRCLKTLQGHTGWVYSVDFGPDGQTLASSSLDFSVKLSYTTNSLMNITGVTGLTQATIASLKALGAVELKVSLAHPMFLIFILH